ncbi:MAG TPA: response regulator [Longimicrobiales bacterium]
MKANKQRVMLVDDEEGVRLSWNRYLSSRGFDVTTEESGEGAMSRLSQQPVDVVVSDLRMPGVDGLELLDWVHKSNPDTRFILLTGYGNEEVERKARELGAYQYLNKPISPEALSAVITAAIHLNMLPELTVEPAAPAVEAAAAVHAVEAVAEVAVQPEAAAAKHSRVRRILQTAGGLVIAPVLGLAFVIFLPVIGFGMLFWVIAQAIRNHAAPAKA